MYILAAFLWGIVASCLANDSGASAPMKWVVIIGGAIAIGIFQVYLEGALK